MKTTKTSASDNFCQNVSAIRKKHCLSKKEMARLLGIGIGSLNKLERGIIPERMSCDIIIRISRIFDIEITDIFAENFGNN